MPVTHTRDYTALTATTTGAAGTTTGEGVATDIVGGKYNRTGTRLAASVVASGHDELLFPAAGIQTLQIARAEFRMSEVTGVGGDVNPCVVIAASGTTGIGYSVKFQTKYSTTNQSLVINRDRYFNLTTGGSNANVPGPGAATPGYALTDLLRLELERTGISPSALVARLFNMQSGSPVLIASATGSDTTAALQVAGRAGVSTDTESAAGTISFSRIVIEDSTGATPLVAGTITRTAVGADNNTLSIAAPSGGTGTITYQVHRSATSGFTPGAGTAVAGATGSTYPATYISTLAAGEVAYIKVVFTDGAASPQVATSVQFPATLALPAPVMGSFAVTTANRPVGHMGDSRLFLPDGAATSVPGKFGAQIDPFVGTVTIVNKAVNSSGTAQWIKTAPAFENVLRYSDAVAAFNAAGVTDIVIGLGTNDGNTNTSLPKATYKANLLSIIADTDVDVATAVRWWIVPPFYVVPNVYPSTTSPAFGEASNEFYRLYREAINEIIAANPAVRLMQSSGFQRAAYDNAVMFDGLHATDAFNTQQAILQANDFLTVVNGPPPVDNAPPTFTARAVQTTGLSTLLTISELSTAAGLTTANFILTVVRVGATVIIPLTAVTIPPAGGGTSITLTHGQIYDTDTSPLLTYSGTAIKDVSPQANPLASFLDAPVTNGSRVADPVYSVEAWARLALTGDAAAAAPTDAALGTFKSALIMELAATNPCIGANPPATLASAGDKLAFAQWAGYELAARFGGTPAGSAFFSSTAEIKIGPITRKTGGGATVADGQASWRLLAQSARLRVSCIRAAAIAANGDNAGMFGLAGRRRAIGAYPSVAGIARGLDRDGNVDV